MDKNIAYFIEDVKIAINSNTNNSGLLSEGDVDTLELDELIKSVLVDAVRLVHAEAPIELLLDCVEDGDIGEVKWKVLKNGYSSGAIVLPGNFQRLVWFRASDWNRPVTEAIGVTDPRYAQCTSAYAGVVGTPEFPVVAIVPDSSGFDGGLELQFFSVKSQYEPKYCYLPFPRNMGEEVRNVSERCYPSIVYRAGALALAVLGDQQSETMMEISKSLLI